MKISELFEDTKSVQLPKLDVGDTILVGKFKNRKATIKGFKTDDKNQPIAITNKGDQKLLKPRVPKLYQDTGESKELDESGRLFSGVRLDEIPPKYKYLKLLGRGTTSVVLEKDPDTVLIFTRDSVKTEWLTQNWGLAIAKFIDSYDSYKHHIRGVSEKPINILEMPKLFPLDLKNKRIVRGIMNDFEEIRSEAHRKTYRAGKYNPSQFKCSIIDQYMEFYNNYDESFEDKNQLRTLIYFLANYDEKLYDWDLGPRNFKQTADGKLVVLDPIVDSELMYLFRTRKN